MFCVRVILSSALVKVQFHVFVSANCRMNRGNPVAEIKCYATSRNKCHHNPGVKIDSVCSSVKKYLRKYSKTHNQICFS